MFPYQDPTGAQGANQGLARQRGALEAYRRKLQEQYAEAAAEVGSRFVALEKFAQLKPGAKAERATIAWEAFPIKQAGFTDSRLDRDRQDLQEEYVEWSLSPAAGPPSSLTFTTEFPEYFEALADVSFEALVAGLREIMPSANPTSQELLGVARAPGPLAVDGIVGGQTWAVLNRVAAMDDRPADQPVVRRGDRGRAVQRLQERLQSLDLLKLVDGDFGPITERAVVTAQQQYRGAGHLFRQQLNRNPWNDGSKGMFCMFQRFNRLNFLFRLVSQCCVPKPINPRAMCALVSPNCVPERNSDPMVCATAQRQVQAGRLISLRDPVGIRILELKGRWQLNGQAIEINNPAKNQGIWQVSRGGQRGVLRLLPGLTVDSATIRTGAQVARKVMVGVDVLVAEASSFK